MALAAVASTGIRYGIYRFATHEDMNLATEEALMRAVCLNLQARASSAGR